MKLGNGTFGITSGTLGCNGETEITVNANVKQFASVNLDQLSADDERALCTWIVAIQGGPRTHVCSDGTRVTIDPVDAGRAVVEGAARRRRVSRPALGSGAARAYDRRMWRSLVVLATATRVVKPNAQPRSRRTCSSDSL